MNQIAESQRSVLHEMDDKDQLKNISDLVGEDEQESVSSDEIEQSAVKPSSAKKSS